MDRLLLCCLFAIYLAPVLANNIQVSDTRIAEYFDTQQLAYVNFDLSWENSWRVSSAPGNWDAAWVFVKFRKQGGQWEHATIIGGTKAAGSVLATTPDTRGAFIYRDAVGSGAVTFADNQLLWDYGADGVTDHNMVRLKVFAIETVYVPTGAFTLGYTNQQGALSMIRANGDGSYSLFPVPSEAAIDVGEAGGNLIYSLGPSAGGDMGGPIPAAFPKGVAAFYSMKYEVTQAQYVAFYNSLTPSQQAAIDLTDANGKDSNTVVARNGITTATNGIATTSLPHVALNYLSPVRAWAYLDWAGLRPMTEFEFEKAARGPEQVTFNEYAWGTTELSTNSHVLTDGGTAQERFSGIDATAGNAVFNSNYDATGNALGPIRVGGIAASVPGSSQQRTGAGYYGTMDQSGNVSEMVVSIGNVTGREFTGQHGDGELSAAGQASDLPNWPTATAGYGLRGGSYGTLAAELCLSDRRRIIETSGVGSPSVGFRGVRTAQ